MKRFKFTLQPVFDYKKTVEKRQKDDLRRAQEELRRLRDEELRIDLAFENNSRALDTVLEQNVNVVEELPKFDAYFRYLREAKKELLERIGKAEAEKDRCMSLLIKTMREIKVYTRLREEQYSGYLEEVAREDAKDMGDIVSFQTVSYENA